jgi:hypothetical protein
VRTQYASAGRSSIPSSVASETVHLDLGWARASPFSLDQI